MRVSTRTATRPHRRRTRFRAAVLAALLALLTAGCRLDATMTVDVDGDGGGTLTVAIRADRDLVGLAEQAEVDPLATLAQAVADQDGWRVRSETHPTGGRSVALSAKFADPEEFAGLTRQLASALSAPELTPLGEWRIVVDDERVRVEGQAALEPSADPGALGRSADDARRALAQSVVYTVRVKLPGQIVDTNADRLDDGVLRWIVPAGAQVRIVAESDRPDRRVWPLVLGGILAGLGSAALLRRRADRTAV